MIDITKYGKIAIEAALLSKGSHSPIDAWEMISLKVFPDRASAREKGCPKNAFLGLCSSGLIKGIPSGHYTQSDLNRKYAENAVRELRTNPSMAGNPELLWKKVCESETKSHNGQMDVVLSLWNNDLVI